VLTVLILACPYLCGAAEAEHAASHEHAANAPADHSAPAHCPQESDDCICRGAVQSADVRVPGVDHFSVPFPVHGLAGLLDHTPAHSYAHLTPNGKPTGLAGWGDASTVRAILQNFRF
jgi:hypothetical protein